MTRHQPRSEREKQIVEAAIKTFAANGYHLTTMDAIAEAVGLSKGSLYRYFPSKQQLFLAILDEMAEPMFEAIEEETSKADSAAQKLEIVLNTILRMSVDAEIQEVGNLTVDFYAATRFDDEVNEALHEMIEPFFEVMTQIIEDGIKAGQFRKVNPRQIAVMLAATLDGMQLYQMIGVHAFDMKTYGDTFLKFTLEALRLS